MQQQGDFNLLDIDNVGLKKRGFGWAGAEGRGENVSRDLGGGSTVERALQNHYWRPQKVGLVLSAPKSCIAVR